jgi:hypothetical protein
MTSTTSHKKLSDLPEEAELWRGSIIRLLNDGKNLHPADKYFDYILALSPWDKDFMFLVNITADSHKAGAFYAKKLSIDHSENKMTIKKAALKKALGPDFKNCYLISDGS